MYEYKSKELSALTAVGAGSHWCYRGNAQAAVAVQSSSWSTGCYDSPGLGLSTVGHKGISGYSQRCGRGPLMSGAGWETISPGPAKGPRRRELLEQVYSGGADGATLKLCRLQWKTC